MTSVDPRTRPAPDPIESAPEPTRTLSIVPLADRAWQRALIVAGAAYALSRAIVVIAAASVAAAQDPRPRSALRPIVDTLTSWDGRWYFAIIRRGYPHSVPGDITYEQDQARAAFFPAYPMLVRGVDRVLPGGDVFAGLFLNFVLGAVFVLLVGVLTRELVSTKAARRAMVFTALFPGSFVLSYAYSEALMLCLAAGCLLALLRRRWLIAGLLAAAATATRPNAMALVAACAVAAFLAWRRDRDWRALVAPVLAPVGFIAFQLFLGAHTGEGTVWFRVQREAWDEGASFGWTALRDLGEFLLDPFDSATNAVTALCILATVLGLVALRRAKLPAPVVVYTVVVLALMLSTATVTARPRFLLTAFPLLIAVAALWPDDDAEWWPMLLASSSAGLVAMTALYGLYAAIP